MSDGRDNIHPHIHTHIHMHRPAPSDARTYKTSVLYLPSLNLFVLICGNLPAHIIGSDYFDEQHLGGVSEGRISVHSSCCRGVCM